MGFVGCIEGRIEKEEKESTINWRTSTGFLGSGDGCLNQGSVGGIEHGV